jgi:tripartite-type tricarboxylate transporter receptor subunit TctC
MVDPQDPGWASGAASAFISRHPTHPVRATMTNIPRTTAAGVEELQADLQRLVAAIQGLPEEHSGDVIAALERVVESTKRRRRILTLVQDALSQLRLDMKYLMFDLEATRRERDDYLAKLEQQES